MPQTKKKTKTEKCERFLEIIKIRNNESIRIVIATCSEYIIINFIFFMHCLMHTERRKDEDPGDAHAAVVV